MPEPFSTLEINVLFNPLTFSVLIAWKNVSHCRYSSESWKPALLPSLVRLSLRAANHTVVVAGGHGRGGGDEAPRSEGDEQEGAGGHLSRWLHLATALGLLPQSPFDAFYLALVAVSRINS